VLKILEFLEESKKAAESGDDRAIQEMNLKWIKAHDIADERDFSVKVIAEIVDLQERGYQKEALKALTLYYDVVTALIGHAKIIEQRKMEEISELKIKLLETIQTWVSKREEVSQQKSDARYEASVILEALRDSYNHIKERIQILEMLNQQFFR